MIEQYKKQETWLEMASRIFSVFNKLYFDDILQMPIFKLGNSKTTCIDISSIIVQAKHIFYQMTIPFDSLNEIEIFTISILDGMIKIYDYMYDCKWLSRGRSYKNSGYKNFVENICHLNCDIDETDSGTTYGVKIKNDELILELCKEHGFKKAWGKTYKSLDINNRLSNNKEKVLRPSSTRKYIDSFGNSVRATKNHFLICFDEYPEIGEFIEKEFGIERMHLD